MPYGVEPAVLRELVARFGSLPKAAAAAKEVPGFGEQIKSLEFGISLESAYGRHENAARNQADYWALIVAALPPDGEGDKALAGGATQAAVAPGRRAFQGMAAPSARRGDPHVGGRRLRAQPK